MLHYTTRNYKPKKWNYWGLVEEELLNLCLTLVYKNTTPAKENVFFLI